MKDKYFELRTNEGFKLGQVVNISEDMTDDVIRERIEVNNNNESIIMIDDIEDGAIIDIIFDWISLDFETGIDENLIMIDDVIQASIELGIEDKVVFSALSAVKKDNNLDIAIAMQDSYSNLTK